jgi:hypothetical protein
MEESKKPINLVYDDWDEIENKPINNGDKYFNIEPKKSADYILGGIYPTVTFGDTHHLMWSYLCNGIFFEYLKLVIPEDEKFTLKKCKFSEVYENPNEKYYYFLSVQGKSIEFMLEKTKFQGFFDNTLKKTLTECKNFYFGIVTEHECDNERGLFLFDEFFKKNGIDRKQIFLINNNAILNDIKEKYNSEINTYSLNFLSISSTRVLDKSGECKFITNKTGKFFMCFNRGPKKHRYGILCLLRKNKILDDINWSLIPTYSSNPTSQFYEEIFNIEEINDMKDDVDFFQFIKQKRNDYEIDANYIDQDGNFIDGILPHWMLVPTLSVNHENSYVNIVTESQFFDYNNVVHITEKSFKPFFYFQFPIILATHLHIKKMRELYDLDFFDDIIDHSYDNEPDQKKRLYMLVNEIKRIHDNKDFFIEFYKNNQQRFEDNKNRIYKLLFDKKDFTFFKNLI